MRSSSREGGFPPLPGKSLKLFTTAIRESGLVAEGDSGVVMVSGGADSVALLAGLHSMLAAERLVVLHVNYGLRDSADDDEALVRQLCEHFEVELVVHKAGSQEGNLQAWAREIRHQEAERIRAERGLDWIAVGHNRSDQAETFIYRLASSPGTRSLQAMPPRSGSVIRPLLALDRRVIRDMMEHGLRHAEDPTNHDRAFARNRIRLDVLPSLEAVNSSAELNIVKTRAELVEDDEALMEIAARALLEAGPEGLSAEAITDRHPAVARRMIRYLAETELGRTVPVPPALVAEVTRLSADPEGGKLDLGGGDFLLIESGRIRACASGSGGEGETPEPVRVGLEPGKVEFGDWELASSVTSEQEARSSFGDPWKAFLDHGDLLMRLIEGSPGPDDLLLNLRPWRSGDRIEPLGMTGSKTLQDLFTDALVPASRRRSWPVLVVGETVIWVPGLARSRHLLIGGPDSPVLRLHARPPFAP